jgi:hypothetical protein
VCGFGRVVPVEKVLGPGEGESGFEVWISRLLRIMRCVFTQEHILPGKMLFM